MSDRSNGVRRDRRSFLRTVAIAGGAAGTAGVTGGFAFQSEAEPETPTQSKSEKSQGYRLTPHIQKYYEKATM